MYNKGRYLILILVVTLLIMCLPLNVFAFYYGTWEQCKQSYFVRGGNIYYCLYSSPDGKYNMLISNKQNFTVYDTGKFGIKYNGEPYKHGSAGAKLSLDTGWPVVETTDSDAYVGWIDTTNNEIGQTLNQIIECNCDIYDYNNNKIYNYTGDDESIIINSPQNNQTYTTYPDISITTTGMSTVGFTLHKVSSYTSVTSTDKLMIFDSISVTDNVANTYAAEDLPYTNGKYIAVFVNSGVSYTCQNYQNGMSIPTGAAVVQFEINITTQSKAEIRGIIDGEQLQQYKYFNVLKQNYSNQIALEINGNRISLINEKDTVKYFNTNDLYEVGYNEIELIDTTNNTVVDSISFTLLRADFTNVEVGGGTGAVISDIPVRPIDGDILDWIEYIGNSISWLLELLFENILEFAKNIGNSILTLLEIITPSISFVQQVTTALPQPFMSAIFSMFIITCVFTIIKLVRG